MKPISFKPQLRNYAYFFFLSMKSVNLAQSACGILLSAAVKFGLSLIPDPQSGGLQRKRHFSQKLGLINVCDSSPAFQSVHFQQGDVSPIYLRDTSRAK